MGVVAVVALGAMPAALLVVATSLRFVQVGQVQHFPLGVLRGRVGHHGILLEYWIPIQRDLRIGRHGTKSKTVDVAAEVGKVAHAHKLPDLITELSIRV